jgi:hypothetical protein
VNVYPAAGGLTEGLIDPWTNAAGFSAIIHEEEATMPDTGPHGPPPGAGPGERTRKVARTMPSIEAAEALAGFAAQRGTRGELIHVSVLEVPQDPRISLVYRIGPGRSDLEYVVTTKRGSSVIGPKRGT